MLCAWCGVAWSGVWEVEKVVHGKVENMYMFVQHLSLCCLHPHWRPHSHTPYPLTPHPHTRSSQEVVVLENKSAQAATAEILHDHSIPSLVSKDLVTVLPDQLKTKLPAEQLVAAVAGSA